MENYKIKTNIFILQELTNTIHRSIQLKLIRHINLIVRCKC
uniref:Uncharacterized protein n=1 Tax=Ciona intestinalis TaxID=7719 RepID=H2XMU7_CIOIN